MKAIGQGRLDGKRFKLFLLRPEEIVVLPQMRKTFDQKSIEDLAESIRANGQINEALVNLKNDRFELIAGERRLRAIKHLNKEDKKRRIVCKVFDGLGPSDCFQLQIAENVHENVPPDQEAEALYCLWSIRMETPELRDITLRRFCKLVGKSETKVRGALRFITGLHPVIREEVRKGKRSSIPYSAAVEIARLNSQDDQFYVYQKALSSDKRTVLVIKFYLEPYLQKQLGQKEFSFEMKLVEHNEIEVLRRTLLKSLGPKYRDSLDFYGKIISAIERGILPREILTNYSVDLLRKALHLDDRLVHLIEGWDNTA